MSSSIDQRIVEMTFKGATFLTGVSATISALSRLKSGLSNLKGGEKDINQLDEAGKRFSLSGMADSIGHVAHQFSLLRIAGLTVFTSLVRQGLFAGERLLKAFTIDPIKAGLDVYETKINAIKTILANTQAEGTKLKDVTAALNQLNIYANRTVYNFGQMARNIGTFTAAGVDLKTSVASIKGIANLAALSGSSAEQASTAMYQLSQAIAAGTVKLQDWNSVVNAGLGGKVFQNQLIETARATGVNIDAIIKKAGLFRKSLQQGWLSSKILTQTLETFTGDLTDQQLRAMGFTAAETKAIQKQAAAAVSSATQIRTISQLFQALKEEVATAWSRVFEALIGNIGQATGTLSKIHTVLENFFTGPINSLAKYLEEWNKLGGRAKFIDAFSNAFKFLGAIMRSIGSAFKEVFPPSTTNTLLTLTTALDNFSKHLVLSTKDAEEVKSTFAGIFSVIKIVIDVIEAVAKGFGIMFGAVASGGGGFLSLTAKIGDFITKVRLGLESGNALAKFFEGLGKILALPVKAVEAIIGALGGLGAAAGKATGGISNFMNNVKQLFSKFTDFVAQGIKSGNFSALAGLINQLLIGGILLKIKSFISNLGKSSGEGLFATIKASFKSLTETLEVMQANLKSNILEKIAIAVGILAASLLVLSLINVGDLTKALAAITALFIELGVALKQFTVISEDTGIVKIAAIGVALNLLATSILILAGAVAIFAQFSWEQLAKGLAAIAVVLGELVATTSLLSKDSSGLIASSIAMGIMAVALNILAIAVGRLGNIPLGNLTKGIASIGVLLGILAGFNAISGAQLIGTATAMVILGAALVVIAQAVKTLGSLSPSTLAKGLLAVAIALGIIAVAMDAMPPTMFVTAASLLLVSAALVVLSNALTKMGGLSWTAIAKSLIVLAASLTIIAIAMAGMTGALPGAAALLVVAASLAILTPILIALSGLSWEGIAKALVALAGAFVIIGVAGLLLAPLIPSLLGLGLAITLLGVGILAAGAGVLLFAAGLTALAVAVTASGAAILSFVSSVLSLIPLVFKKLGEGIIAFAEVIAKSGPAIVKALVTLLSSLLDAIAKIVPKAAKTFEKVLEAILGVIDKESPKIIKTLLNLLGNLLNAIADHVPKFVNAGVRIIVAFLNGIANNIGRVARAGGNVVIAFINAVGNQSLRITQAGINMIIHFINGLADQIRSSSGRLRAAAGNLGGAIIDGLTFGLASKAGSLFDKARSIAGGVLSILGKIVGFASPAKKAMPIGASIVDGLAVGMQSSVPNLEKNTRTIGTALLSTLAKTLSEVGNIMNDSVDLQPRITPVVDLTEATKSFRQLSLMSKSQLISATASSAKASSISAANTAAAEAAGLLQTGGGVNLTFNQTNNSPEPLSTTTIYRQTKNQLSITKGVLAKNATNVG